MWLIVWVVVGVCLYDSIELRACLFACLFVVCVSVSVGSFACLVA